MELPFLDPLFSPYGSGLLTIGAGVLGTIVGSFWLRRLLTIEPEASSFRATADPEPRRAALLALGLVIGVAAVTAWAMLVPQACFVGSRPPAPNEPWYGVYVARPMLVVAPALVFFGGGYVALGTTSGEWQLIGLVLTGVAAVAAFFVGAAVLPICT